MLFFILGRRYIGIRVWRQACPPAKRQAALKHCSPLALALFSPALRGGAECRLMQRESSQKCLSQESSRSFVAFLWPPSNMTRGSFPKCTGAALVRFAAAAPVPSPPCRTHPNIFPLPPPDAPTGRPPTPASTSSPPFHNQTQ